MINSRVFLNVRIVREKKARLNRYCLRHGLVLNDVVNAQLQPLFDAIEREEAEAGRAGADREAGERQTDSA